MSRAGAAAVALAACSAPAAHAPAAQPRATRSAERIGPETPFLDVPGLTQRTTTQWSEPWPVPIASSQSSWTELMRDGEPVCWIAGDSRGTAEGQGETTRVLLSRSGTSPLRFDVHEHNDDTLLGRWEHCTRYELPDDAECRELVKRDCTAKNCPATFTVTKAPGTGQVTVTATRHGAPWVDALLVVAAGATDTVGGARLVASPPPGHGTLIVFEEEELGRVDLDFAADQDLTVEVESCSCCDQ